MPNTPGPPEDKDGPSKWADARVRVQRSEYGLMGYLFGTKENAPLMIGGFSIIASLIIIGVSLLMSDKSPVKAQDVFASGIGLMTLSIGYVFGRASA